MPMAASRCLRRTNDGFGEELPVAGYGREGEAANGSFVATKLTEAEHA